MRATYGWGVPVPPPLVGSAVPKELRDRVQLVRGMPVVHVGGTPREMGRQAGRILRKQIRFLHKEYAVALMLRAIGQRNAEEWAKAVEPLIPERYREEMRGLAEGAGMAYEDVLLFNTMVDRFQAMVCSTVVASGEAAKDGDVYFGRNLDFLGRGILHRATVVIVYEPKDGTRLVSVTWPGLIGVLSGMNEHGVAGATMMIHGSGTARPGVPYMLMYRDALANARKTSDVFDRIQKTRRTVPNNFMVADATGASVVIEFDSKHAAFREADTDCACATNHFRTGVLKDTGIPLGVSRYKDLAGFLKQERGRIDVDAVRKALSKVARPWWTNVQSMIFLPRRREMHVSLGGKLPVANQPFVHLTRKVLFPNRGTGVGSGGPGAAGGTKKKPDSSERETAGDREGAGKKRK